MRFATQTQRQYHWLCYRLHPDGEEIGSLYTSSAGDYAITGLKPGKVVSATVATRTLQNNEEMSEDISNYGKEMGVTTPPLEDGETLLLD